MSAVPVPAKPEAIDAEWLRRAAGPRIPAFEQVRVERIGEGFGLDGQVARLVLDPRSPSRHSLVAKCCHARAGRGEIHFYVHLAPQVPVRLAGFLGGWVDEEAQRAILLLEDLAPARQGDAVVGATREEGVAVMRTMRRFHAAFEGAPREAYGGLADWRGDEEGLTSDLEARCDRFLARFGERLDARVAALLGSLADRVVRAVAELEALPRTLIHTDLHLDNVLFLPSGEPVVIDWPGARRGPAILDVARLLVEGMTPSTRRAHEAAFLEAHGGGRDGLEAALMLFLTYAVRWGGAERRAPGHPRAREIVASLVRNTTAAAADHLVS